MTDCSLASAEVNDSCTDEDGGISYASCFARATVCQAGRTTVSGCNFASLSSGRLRLVTNVIINTYARSIRRYVSGTIFARFCKRFADMVVNWSKLDQVNVLASGANWAWPQALRYVLQPRSVNLLVADSVNDFVHIIGRRRIHTTIVDMDSEESNGLATIKIIRMDYPLMPCVLLTSAASEAILGEALQLDVFGVIDKPVDMSILRELLNRLFLKKYNSNIFAE